MPTTFSGGLPAKATAITSVNDSLTSYFAMYPIIPEAALFGSLEAVYQHDGRYARAFDWWTVHVILAIVSANKSQNRQSNMYDEAVRHVNNALEYAESVLRPGSILGIQAMVLLAIYSLVDPSHFNCWFLVGTASRMMVDLGIYQDIVESKVSSAVPDTRQRIIQCIYSLDRSVPSWKSLVPLLISTNLEHAALRLSAPCRLATTPFPSLPQEWPVVSIHPRQLGLLRAALTRGPKSQA